VDITVGLPLPTVQAAIIQTISEARSSGQLPKERIAEPVINGFNLPMMRECEIVSHPSEEKAGHNLMESKEQGIQKWIDAEMASLRNAQ
jgi:hypothetical protein